MTDVVDLRCAFCGTLDRLEDAHVKDEHVLLRVDGLSTEAARAGNIIPLCHVHHRHYFDCPRKDPNGRGENREFQFEPKLIIDLTNRNLILYDERNDDGTLAGLMNAVLVQPMYAHNNNYLVRPEYATWKNKRMNPRLKDYIIATGLYQDVMNM